MALETGIWFPHAERQHMVWYITNWVVSHCIWNNKI